MIGQLLSEFQAVQIILAECRSHDLAVNLTEDIFSKEIVFEITSNRRPVLSGSICHIHPSGFPVKVSFPSGSLVITSADGLRQFLRETALPETYHTDRRHTSGVAMCRKCLRAHDPSKPINCECGYTTPKPVREQWENSTTTAKVCKLDGSEIKIGDPVYYFPNDPESLAKAKAALNDRRDIVMPTIVPDWTRIDYEALKLPELQQLRDRLNEIIYDQERANGKK